MATATDYLGKVVGIADGDTFTLLVDREQLRIRLAEIDTPEKGQPYGNRARQALSALIYGKPVRVVEIDHDRYGRVVGRVFVGRIDVNAEMVRRGAAWVYRKYAKDPSLLPTRERGPSRQTRNLGVAGSGRDRLGSGVRSAANRTSAGTDRRCLRPARRLRLAHPAPIQGRWSVSSSSRSAP